MVVDQSSSAKAIKRQLKHSTGLDPSNSAVYKAKAAIINSAIGDETDSFKRLPARGGMLDSGWRSTPPS
ncbi:unnamed protein product [Tilletia laevis]|nr:unnamed protein product [Tilletia laevis]CAD6963950.1 unnamed protein product [Tilletia caries]